MYWVREHSSCKHTYTFSLSVSCFFYKSNVFSSIDQTAGLDLHRTELSTVFARLDWIGFFAELLGWAARPDWIGLSISC